jgi:hypothetical protein
MVCPLWNLAPYTAWLAFSPTTGRMPPTSRHTSTAHTGLPNSIMSSTHCQNMNDEFNNEPYSLP